MPRIQLHQHNHPHPHPNPIACISSINGKLKHIKTALSSGKINHVNSYNPFVVEFCRLITLQNEKAPENDGTINCYRNMICINNGSPSLTSKSISISLKSSYKVQAK